MLMAWDRPVGYALDDVRVVGLGDGGGRRGDVLVRGEDLVVALAVLGEDAVLVCVVDALDPVLAEPLLLRAVRRRAEVGQREDVAHGPLVGLLADDALAVPVGQVAVVDEDLAGGAEVAEVAGLRASRYSSVSQRLTSLPSTSFQ
ncbi:hypothetical protein ABT390_35340 [Streptomyces aurantiacus]|uniref:hypothetical protein n=1 Tax=Streptomyces aurantiacus TaxID=47760 RepID=UPI001319C568|nr:hypothetical protein [Streptomyces aurantiacus]